MKLRTISQVSKEFGISTRMLRYYEQIGLIESLHREDYAYRIYDDVAQKRLQLIIILRKLRIPVKEIRNIIENQEAAYIIEIFRKNINEMTNEINALSTIQSLLNQLIIELREKVAVNLKINLLNEQSTLSVINALSLTNNQIKETTAIDDLNDAYRNLKKAQDVRIVNLLPSTVASMHCISDTPENDAEAWICKFIDSVNLYKIKPDAKLLGFNNPCLNEEGVHGYEMWITIPDDMDVPSPLKKKFFPGGLYGAYTSNPINFDDWSFINNWAEDNDDYEYDSREPFAMGGNMEDHYNFHNQYNLSQKRAKIAHIDFLIPIKEKDS